MSCNYDDILELIHKLPEKDIEKLTITLQSEIKFKKSSDSIKELILKAPTWTDSDFEHYKNARKSINQSRLA